MRLTDESDLRQLSSHALFRLVTILLDFQE